jgi:hypothetical protein
MPLHSQAFYVPVTVVLLNILRRPIITFFRFIFKLYCSENELGMPSYGQSYDTARDIS